MPSTLSEILPKWPDLPHFTVQLTRLEMPPETGFWDISPDAWVAIFTGLLFLATIIQSGFALRADYLTRKSLALTREQARTSRNAAIAALSVELPVLEFGPPGFLYNQGEQ